MESGQGRSAKGSKPTGRSKPRSAKAEGSRLSDRNRRIIRALVLIIVAGLVLGAGAAAGFVLAAWRDMPQLTSIEPTFLATSFIYDMDGEQVCGLAGPENRIPVSLSQMSEPLIKAYIAHEDRYFYNHHGVVIRAIIRAFYADLTGGRPQGGSTITQQLARTSFLTLDRTLKRKIQEAILAIQLERMYTKDEILEMYLNQIPLGHGAWGVEAAARNYFGKSADELSLAESAMITGLTKSPGVLSPYRNLESARAQQSIVLNQMVREGFISSEESEAAKQEELVFPGLVPRTEYPYPFFIDYVLDQLLNVHKLDADLVYTGGLRIYTTLDPKIQAAAEKGVATNSVHFPTNSKGERAECGIVIMENDTGYLRAIVGGVDHHSRLQFNFATQSKRQPGSAFKPIVDYTPAIDRGFAPSTVVDDAPAVWFTVGGDAWHPKNYDDQFRGMVNFRLALERSINVPAAKVLTWVGIRTGIEYAQRMGIDSLVTSGTINDVTWSLSLGALTHGVSPLELTRAYAVLANKGVKTQPMAVLRVVDRAGHVILDNVPRREAVLSEQTAWLVTDMLVGVVHSEQGTGRRARIEGWTLAGKTGTSSDYADAWFAGYSPLYSGAVWLGYPKERLSMGVQFGGMYPALIWREAMVAAHEGKQPVGFEMPRDIVQATVCRKSGKLPGPSCPASDLVTDYFLKGTEPTESCTTHVTARVCLDDPSHLAGPYCPPDRVVWRTFIQRDIYSPWVMRDGTALVPADAHLEVPTGVCAAHNPYDPFEPDQVIHVTMSQGAFNPKTITVAQGTRVRLVLTAGERRYGMAIDGYGVSAVAAAGQTVQVDFVADKPGTFNYYCHVDIGDLKSKMTGRLVVSQ